jgi:trans-aconitate 2-methyltransferase
MIQVDDDREGVPMEKDCWDPNVYERFERERAQPFFDLAGLCSPVPGGRAVDLGCGTGKLTAELHHLVSAKHTSGLDNSPAMLEKAALIANDHVDFAERDIAEFGASSEEPERYDLVFSNAALQWVAHDHREVLAQWRAALRPGGQLAVQMPANADHPSHHLSAALAREEPFLSAFDGAPPPDPVLGVLLPEQYAEALYDLGFSEQHVRLQVYGHVLPSTASVVDWVSGTSLTRFRSRLSPEMYEEFVDAYRERLLAVLGDREPYFYGFKRILLWGRLS